jgi:redox-sensitive bicupin YhaK (pirin superfamily)
MISDPTNDGSGARPASGVEVVLLPRAHDVGGFEVRRALPATERQMVGPFIFFDQMGRASFWPDGGWTSGRTRTSACPR